MKVVEHSYKTREVFALCSR